MSFAVLRSIRIGSFYRSLPGSALWIFGRSLAGRRPCLKCRSVLNLHLQNWFQVGSNNGPKNRHFYGISGAGSTIS